MLNGKKLLLTGGTGSFGKVFTRCVLEKYKPEKFIIFSRDELKQFEMAQVYSPEKYPCLKYTIGDVRDVQRLARVLYGIDYVVHAAAQKQVPAAEDNPTEAIKTNVQGAMNIIDACIDNGVKSVVALSTDKACNPINLYGATKLCSDKLFVAANHYTSVQSTKFSVVRYGNVVGSRGSVIPFFKAVKNSGEIPITDEQMTRFFITLEQGVDFVLQAFARMNGGEIFVPKIPSMKITDVAKVIAPGVKTKIIGIRPGEKLHETMISPDDSRNTFEYKDYYVIMPQTSNLSRDGQGAIVGNQVANGVRVNDGFQYSSDTNDQWLDGPGLLKLLESTSG